MSSGSLSAAPTSAPGRLNLARTRLVAGVVGFAVDLPPEEILATTRGAPPLARARQLVMYLLHAGFSMSLSHIAGALGRDRSTVAHGVQRVEDQRDAPAFDRWLEGLEEMLRLAPEPQLRELQEEPDEALIGREVRP